MNLIGGEGRISKLLHAAVHLVHYEDRPLQFRHCPAHQLVIDAPDLLLSEVLFHETVFFYFQDELRLSFLLSGRVCL